MATDTTATTDTQACGCACCQRERQLGSRTLDEPAKDQDRTHRRTEERELDERGQHLGEDPDARATQDVDRQRADDHPAADEHILGEVAQRPHGDAQGSPQLYQHPVQEAEDDPEDRHQDDVAQRPTATLDGRRAYDVTCSSPPSSADAGRAVGLPTDTVAWLTTWRDAFAAANHPTAMVVSTSLMSPSSRVA